MPKKKCPACGSTDIVKIVYGYPTLETFEAKERGELVLGGCSLMANNPKRHCKACGQDFGKGYIFPFEITSFEFYIGEYFATSHSVYINCKRKNKLIRYAISPYGMGVDLKNSKNDIKLYSNIRIKEITLSDEQWVMFTKEIKNLEIDCWKDKYFDNDICDGIQWELKIRLAYQDNIKKYGSNEYPPYWNKFMKIMKKYIGENIL